MLRMFIASIELNRWNKVFKLNSSIYPQKQTSSFCTFGVEGGKSSYINRSLERLSPPELPKRFSHTSTALPNWCSRHCAPFLRNAIIWSHAYTPYYLGIPTRKRPSMQSSSRKRELIGYGYCFRPITQTLICHCICTIIHNSLHLASSPSSDSRLPSVNSATTIKSARIQDHCVCKRMQPAAIFVSPSCTWNPNWVWGAAAAAAVQLAHIFWCVFTNTVNSIMPGSC